MSQQSISLPEKYYPIQLGELKLNITLVGCGGTGSFVALHLARLAYHVRERHNRHINITFIDPDIVESKNIGRQNFCPAEIGQRKAYALAWRYGRAFGLPISYQIKKFDHSDLIVKNEAQILIGCVDNNHARTDMHKAMQAQVNGKTWWLDCGNDEHDGQVLIGNDAKTINPVISDLGFCSRLPLPTVQHPELLNLLPELIAPEPESCADLAIREAQSLMINQMVAAHAANYLARLILSRDLNMMATYFSLTSGSARSIYITKG